MLGHVRQEDYFEYKGIAWDVRKVDASDESPLVFHYKHQGNDCYDVMGGLEAVMAFIDDNIETIQGEYGVCELTREDV